MTDVASYYSEAIEKEIDMSDYTVDLSNDTCEFLEGLVPNTISRRDYFAAMAMQGLSSVILSQDKNNTNLIGAKKVAECAIEYADALIAELDKKDKSE